MENFIFCALVFFLISKVYIKIIILDSILMNRYKLLNKNKASNLKYPLQIAGANLPYPEGSDPNFRNRANQYKTKKKRI